MSGSPPVKATIPHVARICGKRRKLFLSIVPITTEPRALGQRIDYVRRWDGKCRRTGVLAHNGGGTGGWLFRGDSRTDHR